MNLTLVSRNLTTAIHNLLCVPKVYRYLADNQKPPREIAERWVSVVQNDQQQFGGGLWALTNQELVGLVRLSDYVDQQMELTFLLHPDHWHQGLATRMAHTVIGECFKRGAVNRVWAGADEPNTASINVMRRLNMTFRNLSLIHI